MHWGEQAQPHHCYLPPDHEEIAKIGQNYNCWSLWVQERCVFYDEKTAQIQKLLRVVREYEASQGRHWNGRLRNCHSKEDEQLSSPKSQEADSLKTHNDRGRDGHKPYWHEWEEEEDGVNWRIFGQRSRNNQVLGEEDEWFSIPLPPFSPPIPLDAHFYWDS